MTDRATLRISDNNTALWMTDGAMHWESMIIILHCEWLWWSYINTQW
jgi:hypothetical protein